MKSAWNLVGMALWLLLIVYFAYIIHDMRARRLRLIVTEKRVSPGVIFGFPLVNWLPFAVLMGNVLFNIFPGCQKDGSKPDYYQLYV